VLGNPFSLNITNKPTATITVKMQHSKNGTTQTFTGESEIVAINA
jgi:hypothetical protein